MVQGFVDLRGIPLLPRLADGAEEPGLQFRWEERPGDPVDGIGDEMTGIEEEPKKLRENRQRTAQHVQHCASSVVRPVKKTGYVL